MNLSENFVLINIEEEPDILGDKLFYYELDVLGLILRSGGVEIFLHY